jgi:hypothetical protein
MRYIYFEKYKLIKKDTGEIIEDKIQNLNVLLLRPDNLNTSGYWEFSNLTERKNQNENVLVEQYWIDIKVYNSNGVINEGLNEIKRLLKTKKREIKLNSIL